jgi:signal transduction histidine kinase
LLFLSSNHILGGLRDVALTTVVVVVALGLILAPFLWRLGRNLAAERAERIRSQERAEVAAHLHDSVLQTLTLMQKRADDPREVAALARRQERELRDWLAGNDRRSSEKSFAGALRSAAEEVEDDHRVAVEVVVVGDTMLDERSEAVLGAAREALLNAAKHAAEPGPIRLYGEVDDASIEVFVRDRGAGFDPAAVAADRRGVRESIIGRMERAGGRAEVRSTGGGTEVGLSIERSGAEHGEGRR